MPFAHRVWKGRGTGEGGRGEHPVQQQMGAAHPVPWEASSVDRGCHGGGDGRTQGARRDHPEEGTGWSTPASAFCPLCFSPLPISWMHLGSREPRACSDECTGQPGELGGRMGSRVGLQGLSAPCQHQPQQSLLSAHTHVLEWTSCRHLWRLGAHTDLVKPSTSFPRPCLIQNVPNRRAGFLLMPSLFQDGAPGNTPIFSCLESIKP